MFQPMSKLRAKFALEVLGGPGSGRYPKGYHLHAIDEHGSTVMHSEHPDKYKAMEAASKHAKEALNFNKSDGSADGTLGRHVTHEAMGENRIQYYVSKPIESTHGFSSEDVARSDAGAKPRSKSGGGGWRRNF